MRALFREDVPITDEGEGMELRTCPIGGAMSVAFVTLPPGGVLRDDLPPRSRPRWGYLLRGRMRLTTRDGIEVVEAGQALHLDAGPAAEALEDCEYLGFSPTQEA